MIQFLKHQANMDSVVGFGFIFVLLAISSLMGWESIKTIKALKMRRRTTPWG